MFKAVTSDISAILKLQRKCNSMQVQPLLRVLSSVQMNKNALSLGLRLGIFLACS